MGVKITELTTTEVNGSDYIPVANTTSGTRKVLMSDVLAAANPTIDTALSTTSENAVQNKVVAAAIAGIKRDLENVSGLSEETKTALLACFRNVAWIGDDGQDYYDALYDALYAVTSITLSAASVTINSLGGTAQLTATTVPAGAAVSWESSDTSVATVSSSGLVTSVGYGSATITATAGNRSATCAVLVSQAALSSISAVFTQGDNVIYDTAILDTLKQYLVVTAAYSDGSTATVTDYTLSGTLAEGTSTITVSYGGKTATFDVTVTKEPNYVMDNFELWLDARAYANKAVNMSSITDQSGNDVALTYGTGTNLVFGDTYVSVFRGQIKAESAAFLAKLSSGWTIEVAWQNRHLASGTTPTDSGTGNKMVSLRNGNGLLLSGTQIQIPGNNTKLGTERTNTDSIVHAALTYDGTTLTEYLEGEIVFSGDYAIDIANEAFVEFFGNIGYAQQTACSWNAVRVYSKVLTASEIKDNYDLDIVNYGTQNIAAAEA